jgi:hypothetical protein
VQKSTSRFERGDFNQFRPLSLASSHSHLPSTQYQVKSTQNEAIKVKIFMGLRESILVFFNYIRELINWVHKAMHKSLYIGTDRMWENEKKRN